MVMTKLGRLVKYINVRRAMRKHLASALDEIWDNADIKIKKLALYVSGPLQNNMWKLEETIFKYVIRNASFDADVYIRQLESEYSDIRERYEEKKSAFSRYPDVKNKLEEYVNSYPQFFAVMKRAVGLDKAIIRKSTRPPRIVRHLPAKV